LSLGLGNVGIAGAGHQITGRYARGTQCHGADGLHTAQHIDRIGTRQMHGGDDGRSRLALERRRAGHDALDAGDLRRDHTHVRRGDQWILAARHVAADAIHRNILVAENHAGQCLHLDIAQRVALDLGEIANLSLGEADVIEIARGHLPHAGLHLIVAETEFTRIPLIEFARILAHGVIAALLDIRQQILDDLPHLCRVLRILLRADALLDVPDH
jgi:hypothetical protein